MESAECPYFPQPLYREGGGSLEFFELQKPKTTSSGLGFCPCPRAYTKRRDGNLSKSHGYFRENDVSDILPKIGGGGERKFWIRKRHQVGTET